MKIKIKIKIYIYIYDTPPPPGRPWGGDHIYIYIYLYYIYILCRFIIYILFFNYIIKSIMTNCKKSGRDLNRRLAFFIPYKCPGIFDGNLGTYCVLNESATSTSSMPF